MVPRIALDIGIQLAEWEKQEWRKSRGFYRSSYPSISHYPEICLMPNLTAREIKKRRPTMPRMKGKLISHHMSQPLSS
jgi:hypothetical protein